MKITDVVTAPNGEELKRLYDRFGTVVAIDQATRSGVAVLSREHVSLYVASLQDHKRGATLGGELRALATWVGSLKPSVLFFERPAGRHKAAIIKSSKIMGAILAKVEGANGAIAHAFSATEVKKFATDKGRAGKDEMVEAARAEGFPVDDDNQADALFILKMGLERLAKDNPTDHE